MIARQAGLITRPRADIITHRWCSRPGALSQGSACRDPSSTSSTGPQSTAAAVPLSSAALLHGAGGGTVLATVSGSSLAGRGAVAAPAVAATLRAVAGPGVPACSMRRRERCLPLRAVVPPRSGPVAGAPAAVPGAAASAKLRASSAWHRPAPAAARVATGDASPPPDVLPSAASSAAAADAGPRCPLAAAGRRPRTALLLPVADTAGSSACCCCSTSASSANFTDLPPRLALLRAAAGATSAASASAAVSSPAVGTASSRASSWRCCSWLQVSPAATHSWWAACRSSPCDMSPACHASSAAVCRSTPACCFEAGCPAAASSPNTCCTAASPASPLLGGAPSSRQRQGPSQDEPRCLVSAASRSSRVSLQRHATPVSVVQRGHRHSALPAENAPSRHHPTLKSMRNYMGASCRRPWGEATSEPCPRGGGPHLARHHSRCCSLVSVDSSRMLRSLSASTVAISSSTLCTLLI